MKRLLYIFILSVGLLLGGCAQYSSSKDGAQKSETAAIDPYSMEGVMAVHDEVMPKMGEISMLIDALKEQADKNPDSPQANAMSKLQESHKAMMDWMREFGDAFTSDEILKGAALSDEKKERLRLEAERIKSVKTLMLESIAEGQNLLEEAAQ
ncbi:MAG: hypothetical protein VW236_00110 [Flavobacteriaceae bacterium]